MAERTELTVLVVRSGGLAGITRRWAVEAAADDGSWIALIEACPWGAIRAEATGPDRFLWRVEARAGARHREASVPDGQLTGPWRDLVDRVQSEGHPADG